MAVGDVVSALTSIAAGANLDFQPASGVEVMITEVMSQETTGSSPDTVPNVTVSLTDGTNIAAILGTSSVRRWARPLKLFLNNSLYLRITNESASTKYLAYTGIQTK